MHKCGSATLWIWNVHIKFKSHYRTEWCSNTYTSRCKRRRFNWRVPFNHVRCDYLQKVLEWLAIQSSFDTQHIRYVASVNAIPVIRIALIDSILVLIQPDFSYTLVISVKNKYDKQNIFVKIKCLLNNFSNLLRVVISSISHICKRPWTIQMTNAAAWCVKLFSYKNLNNLIDICSCLVPRPARFVTS